MSSLLSRLDTDMQPYESNDASGMLNVELSNGTDFEFDPRFMSERSGHNDSTVNNDQSVEDGLPFPLEPLDPVIFSGGIAPSTEACFGFNEMTTILPQNNSQNYSHITFLSRSYSPHLSDTNLEDFLIFSSHTHSPVAALAATPDVLRHSSRQCSILHGRITPLPEPCMIDDSVRATPRPENTFEAMDLEALTKPFMLMGDIFFNSVYQILNNQPSVTNEDNIGWVTNEFRSILAASHEASASAIRKQLQKSKANEASRTPLRRFSQVMKTRDASLSSKNVQGLRTRQILSTSLVRETSVGYLSIKLYASQGSPLATTATFTFTPASEICERGISATLVRAFDSTQGTCIPPKITSFNIIPVDHPVRRAIFENNIKRVQELFSSRQASPHDRFPDGTSLLSVRQKTLQGCCY